MGLNLIVDADDTLWENNIYFEAAFDRFCIHLAHSSLTPQQIRAVLDEIEIVNAKVHGYGSKNFAKNLTQCFERLAERQVLEEDLAAIRQLALDIINEPMRLIDGVAETVKELAQRHSLTIFTKGDHEEQKLKIDQSGLRQYFVHEEIVKEKNAAAYRLLVKKSEMDPEVTWMIGNSPKSDVNPALEAGLGAVFVPHARTWGLELADLPTQHPRLRKVETFRDLRTLF
jgi:putative hydrolase of the HAD superfamily